jgi:hypothetical protein
MRANCTAAAGAPRCTLADRIAELLDDGTCRIHPTAGPLGEQLRSMDNPLSGLVWLSDRRGTAAKLGARPGQRRDPAAS